LKHAVPSPQVFVTRALPADTLTPLRAVAELHLWPEEEVPVPREVLLRHAREADGLLVLLTDRVDEALLAQAPRLRAVSTMSVGYDHIDLVACARRGIRVCHTPDVLTETTADLAFALLLATARRLYEGQRVLVEGRWPSWSPFFLAGQDVHGRTLGIVGLGRIGQAVARRARGFAMQILYSGRRDRAEAESLGAQRVPLMELAARADFVVLTAAATEETRHLVDASFLARMQPSAILINVARGSLVDEAALVEALRTGRLAGAGLDVFEREPLPSDHPLLQLPQVVAVPHIGSATWATRRAMARRAAENLAAVLVGRDPPACLPSHGGP
jgi:glyoxylate reductase